MYTEILKCNVQWDLRFISTSANGPDHMSLEPVKIKILQEDEHPLMFKAFDVGFYTATDSSDFSTKEVGILSHCHPKHLNVQKSLLIRRNQMFSLVSSNDLN